MAAFTAATTLSNGLAEVTLNRSMLICLVVINIALCPSLCHGWLDAAAPGFQ